MTFLLWLACVWAIWRVIRINKVLQAQNERIKTLEHTLAHLLKTTSQTTSATNTPSKIPLQTQNHFDTRPPKTHATTPKTAIDPTHLNPWYAHHFTLATVSYANIPWRDNKAYRGISHAHPKTWHYPRTTRQPT